MRFAILLAMFLMSACAHQDEWTTRDTWMQVGVTMVLAADAYTTAQIHKNPGIHESGLASKVLGLQPSTSDTYMYFGTLMISDYFITRMMSAKWRKYWQGFEMTVHGYSVVNNCDLGLCP